jgi:ribosomal protein S18 acetylase RimI-like enzyme
MVTSKDSVVLVAEDKGSIAGYLAGKIGKRPPVFEVGNRGEIWSGYVQEEYRGHGVGRELTERMLR